MRQAAPAGFGTALRAIPRGTSCGHAHNRRYIATRTDFNAGKSIKLVAEARDQSDYISLNYYDLSNGAQLAPCEMSDAKVIAFVMDYVPEQETS